jgi:rhomboid family GlyGly-CTERM serine protease
MPVDWWPALVLSAISGMLLWLPSAWYDRLRYDRAAVAAGQWWRLFTANFIHLGVWHYVLNVLSLLLLVLLCPGRLPVWEWVARVVIVAVGTCLGLYWGGQGIASYVGMSGMIYGLFLIGLGSQALTGDLVAVACLVFLVGRVGWEFVVGIPAAEERLIGGRVVPESHLFGMAAALVYAGGAMTLNKMIRPCLRSLPQSR